MNHTLIDKTITGVDMATDKKAIVVILPPAMFPEGVMNCIGLFARTSKSLTSIPLFFIQSIKAGILRAPLLPPPQTYPYQIEEFLASEHGFRNQDLLSV